jgi:nucleoside permease NupC
VTPAASLFDAIADGYRDAILDTGREAELLLLVSFLLAFGFIRTSAHLIRAQVRWWPGNVEISGTHVHHMVWGILLMLTMGYAAIAFDPGAPWRQLLAVGFGIGMGLTLDEFALWLDLRDVYWLPEGRKSIDAVIVAATFGGLLLLGVRIWIDLAHGVEAVVKLVVAGSAAAGVIAALVNALRGRYVAAATSLVVPLAGVVLLALLPPRAGSPWTRAREYRRHHRARSAAAAAREAPPP